MSDIDHAHISRQIVCAISAVKRMGQLRLSGRADLRKAVLLTGRDLHQVCELLEHEFLIIILPDEVAQIALDGPTVDRIAETVRLRLDARERLEVRRLAQETAHG